MKSYICCIMITRNPNQNSSIDIINRIQSNSKYKVCDSETYLEHCEISMMDLETVNCFHIYDSECSNYPSLAVSFSCIVNKILEDTEAEVHQCSSK